MQSSPLRNRLVTVLAPEDRERLLAYSRRVVLPNGQVLLAPREQIRYAYFPTDGVVALVMLLEDDTAVEVATVGSEGFVSVESVLGSDHSPYLVACQTPVETLRVEVDHLRYAFRTSDAIRDLLLRYAATALSCAGRSLACKVTHRIEQRLARWLLMTDDRLQGHELPMTHDTLARLLGVRRPTISVAADDFRMQGLIAYHRGKITIIDRPRLEMASCEHYEEFRTVYQDLLGVEPQAGGAAP